MLSGALRWISWCDVPLSLSLNGASFGCNLAIAKVLPIVCIGVRNGGGSLVLMDCYCLDSIWRHVVICGLF